MRRAAVVRLDSFRRAKRVDGYSRRLDEVVANNRSTIVYLFESGMIFHPIGIKAGRGLLRAYENLLRIRSLLGHLKEMTANGNDEPRKFLEEIEDLVVETNRLVERTRTHLSRLGG